MSQLSLAGVLAVLASPFVSSPSHDTPVPIGLDDGHRSHLHHGIDRSGALWARGRTYKARAAGDGFQYVPFLGSDAPRNFPVAFRLVAASAGGRDLALTREAEVRRDGDRITLDRGPVDVVYDLEVDSVEQSFLFDDRLKGEVVLELEVTSDLAASPDGDGFRFAGDLGAVVYGAATALDDAGRSAHVPARLDGTTLELRVPAAFVDAASGSIVVDPVISTFSVDAGPGESAYPDLAYDLTRDAYLAVYEDQFSATDFDIYSVFVDARTGATSDGAYIEMGSELWREPSVGNLRFHETFLVTATVDVPPGRSDIVGVLREADTGTIGAPFTIDAPQQGTRAALSEVSGEAFDVPDTHFAVAWIRDAGSGGDVWVELIDANGAAVAGTRRVLESDPALDTTDVAISRSTGPVSGPRLRTVAWAEDTIPTASIKYDLRAAQLAADNTIASGPTVVASQIETRPLEFLAVSALSTQVDAVSGDPLYAIAYASFPAAFSSTRILLCAGDQPLDSIDLPVSEHRIQNARERSIGFASTGDAWVVTYTQTGLGPRGVFAATVKQVANRLGIAERSLELSGGLVAVSGRPAVALASEYEGGGSSPRTLILWRERPSAGADFDILGARVDAASVDIAGVQYCYGDPTIPGARAFIQAIGTNDTTSPKELVATDLPPNTTGFFLSGSMSDFVPRPFLSRGDLCLGGALGRYSNQIQSSGSSGRISITIDPTRIQTPTVPTSAVAGQSYYFQAWFRDGQFSNFSNGVEIPFR